MWVNYTAVFLFAFLLTITCVWLVKKIALKLNIIDQPNLVRKIHDHGVPLLGGLAIFFSFFIVLFIMRDKILAGNLEIHHWLGFFIGASFLMIGGFLDDKYDLKPRWQIIWPLLAGLSVIIGGVEIEKITNPFGNYIYLGGIVSGIIIFIWLMAMMYATKLLDGIDGLVSGVVAIGALIVFAFTMTTKYFQPDVGLAALILSGACLGFLILNWHPAKIFLGEGGSLFLGFALGVLAIISGGKIAIALLVMGIPILDLAWTIIRRLLARKNPFKFADRLHLHHRLLSLGIGQRRTSLVYYGLALIFGLSGLFLQSLGKMFALLIIFAIMLLLVISFSFYDKKKV